MEHNALKLNSLKIVLLKKQIFLASCQHSSEMSADRAER